MVRVGDKLKLGKATKFNEGNNTLTVKIYNNDNGEDKLEEDKDVQIENVFYNDPSYFGTSATSNMRQLLKKQSEKK